MRQLQPLPPSPLPSPPARTSPALQYFSLSRLFTLYLTEEFGISDYRWGWHLRSPAGCYCTLHAMASSRKAATRPGAVPCARACRSSARAVRLCSGLRTRRAMPQRRVPNQAPP